MKTVLTVGWVALLGFLAWEFLNANNLPAKYGAASPSAFRIADILIGLLAVLSLIYLLRK